MASPLNILRQTLKEIKEVLPAANFRDSQGVRYILKEFKKNKITDEQLCKAHEEMKFMNHTYLCYLRSLRKYNQINATYHGRGERTVGETAKIVGFKLPHDPK